MSDTATLVERLRSYDLRSAITLEAADRIAELEVDYARAEKVAVSLHAITKKAMDRIAELEAELAEITRRAVDDGTHDAIDASARMDEREATLALLDGMPDALARDIASTIRAMGEEPLPNRLAELEAANKICRRDIEALMSSCDKLEKRNTELEAKLILLATEKEGGA